MLTKALDSPDSGFLESEYVLIGQGEDQITLRSVRKKFLMCAGSEVALGKGKGYPVRPSRMLYEHRVSSLAMVVYGSVQWLIGSDNRTCWISSLDSSRR